MAIKRYWAAKDNTITNAYMENLTTRGTGSNMGASDILEAFSIYGQASSSSVEASRVLIKFNTTASTNSIKADRDNGKIPVSGSVSFYLRMFNAPHGQTLPKSYTMDITAVSGTWDEGTGLDMEGYKDKGSSNWVNRHSTTAWADHAGAANQGGVYHSDISSSFSASFDSGVEDIEVDITPLVEQWLNSAGNVLGSKGDEGVGVFISNTYGAASRSYYTKKFFGRGSEYFYKRPHIEARWNSATKDERGSFNYSSSLADSTENMNTLYFYNYFKGRLRNIPGIGTGKIYVSFFSGNVPDEKPSGDPLSLVVDQTSVADAARNMVVTGGYVSAGVYTASVAMTSALTPLETVYDVWFSGGFSMSDPSPGSTQYHTGAIYPIKLSGYDYAPSTEYATSISNLKDVYRETETARFRTYVRQKDWNPTIYTKARSQPATLTIESGSYEIYRVVDDYKVIPFGTGSDMYTQMAFDMSGNYFDLDMRLFEPGYMYGIKFAYYNPDVASWVQQPETFKFRVKSGQN